VALAVATLSGCAAPRVEVPQPLAQPRIAARPGRPGLVVAALDGGGDVGADDMATEIAQRTGFGLVVARGASTAYEQRVLEVAQGPLRFYAELHGAGRAECAGRIDIATVGVDRELALRWRALAELIRDAHLRANAEVQRLDVRVEPADALSERAAPTPRAGVLRLTERGLQIELPRCARRDWRETYTAILADFLAQAVMLPVGR
jgi:hypothetical protein